MKQELKTIALVISIMIKEMDQRETKRCIINLRDQLPTQCSMTAGCSAPYKHRAVWMLENSAVLPEQHREQPAPPQMEGKPPCPSRKATAGKPQLCHLGPHLPFLLLWVPFLATQDNADKPSHQCRRVSLFISAIFWKIRSF